MSNQYYDLLKNPLWQKKRLERLEKSNWQCENCGANDNSLHVHHKLYFKNKNPWDYDDEQLEVLCDPCHKNAHNAMEAIKTIISYSDKFEIYNLLCGYCDEEINHKYELEPNDIYDNYLLCRGIFAGLMQYVHPKNYNDIAEYIINLSFDKENATNFFRIRFDDLWSENE